MLPVLVTMSETTSRSGRKVKKRKILQQSPVRQSRAANRGAQGSNKRRKEKKDKDVSSEKEETKQITY